MAKNFRELEAKMLPGARARSDAKTQKMIEEIKGVAHQSSRRVQDRKPFRHLCEHVAQSHRGDGWQAGDSREVSGWRSADSCLKESESNSKTFQVKAFGLRKSGK